MAKTLVINEANFASVALTQVEFNTVECTGITLDETAISIVTTGNTSTLTATVTPEDCTQAVRWSSSDEDVAIVSNGVVTATGIGTATITATCGRFSASTTVTVTESMNKPNLMKMSGVYIGGESAVSGGNGITYANASASYKNRGGLASSEGSKYCASWNGTYFYPYKMPKGTKRIRITDTGASGIKKQLLLWYNSATGAVSNSDFVQYIDNTALSSISENPYVVNVPVVEGYPEIDSFMITFRTYKSGTTFVDADFDDVSVEFLTEE